MKNEDLEFIWLAIVLVLLIVLVILTAGPIFNDVGGVPTSVTQIPNNVPVIMDVTHSLQQPNSESGVTGGKPAMIETIAKASIAVGVDGLFIETHPDPKNAKSDGANMLPLDQLEALMIKLIRIREAIR